MKKAALFSLLIVFSLWAGYAPEAALPTVEDLDENTVFPLELDFGVMPPFPIPHCGDFCQTPGQQRGCIDTSGPHYVKTPCTCLAGTWTC